MLCAVYFSFAWFGFDLLEEGYFMTQARRVQLGGLPYRDFSAPYTPGVFYLYAWMMDWFGPSVVPLRALQIAGRAVVLLALYASSRRVMPPYFAALPPAMIVGMDTAPVAWGIHPGWYAAPAALLAVLAIAHYVQRGGGRWLFAAGVASGVAFAFKQNIAVYGLMAALWLLVVAEAHLPRLTLPRMLGALGRGRGAAWSWRSPGSPAGSQEPPQAVDPRDKEHEPAGHRFHVAAPSSARASARDREQVAVQGAAWSTDRAAGGSYLARVWRLVRVTLRASLQVAALALLPATVAVLVRPYFSTLVANLFVLPLAALSIAAAALFTLRRPAPEAPLPEVSPEVCAERALGRDASFYVRPLLLLSGFGAVTLPWLMLLIRALDGKIALLAPFVGKIDPSGYYFGMALPTLDHLRLVGMLLLAPVLVAALAAIRISGRQGAVLAFGALTWLVTRNVLSSGGAEEPWSAASAVYRYWEGADTAWREYGQTSPRTTDDLLLYLPTLAFWTALAYLVCTSARRPPANDPEPTTAPRQHVLRLWYLTAGAALLLNQYPRMDHIHLAWSTGVLLVAGADVLHACFRQVLGLAPPQWWSPASRATLRLSLTLLPAAAAFPYVWWRLDGIRTFFPAPVAEVHAARPGARAHFVPLDLLRPAVWVPEQEARPIQEIVELLQEKTASGEPIFTYPAIPGFYFLADRPNATRFNHLFAGMASSEEQHEMVEQLEVVRYVVWDDGGAHFWVQPGDNAPITEYIRRNFRVERFVGQYTVLARDARGPELPYFPPG